jgi:hypothetical protein
MTLEDEIYQLYPRKVGKRAALTAITRCLKRLRGEVAPLGIPQLTRFDWLKQRVTKFAASPKGNAGEYTPHPATWFNQSRYLDDDKEWFKGVKANGVVYGDSLLEKVRRQEQSHARPA